MQKKSEAAWAICLSEIDGGNSTPKALAVTVVCGQNFPKTDKFGTCDPFIRFKPDDGQTITKLSSNVGNGLTDLKETTNSADRKNLETSVAKQTMFPRWDEKFLITFVDDENPGKLNMAAWDYDTLTDIDYIGDFKILCETLELWMQEDIGFVVPMVCEVLKNGEVVKGGESGSATTVHLKFEVVLDKAKDDLLKV